LEVDKRNSNIIRYARKEQNCEGKGLTVALEFSKSDLPEMIEKIKGAILYELDEAEHLDDARNYVKEYL